MKKIKLSLYQISDILASPEVGKNFRERGWGWYDLLELADHTLSTPKMLLHRFIGLNAKNFFSSYHTHTGFGKMKLAIITGIITEFDAKVVQFSVRKYKLNWYDHEDLFDKAPTSSRPILVDEMLRGKIFVPAGWGLAVLKEIDRKNQHQTASAKI